MRYVITLAAGFLLAVLVFTNPGMEDFRAFVQDRTEAVLRQQTGDGALGRLFSRFGSNVTGALANRIGTRDNYGLFSLYTIDLGGDGRDGDRWRFVGVAGRFFELDIPDALRED